MVLANSQYDFIEALLSKRAVLHVKCRFLCEPSPQPMLKLTTAEYGSKSKHVERERV